MLLLHQTHLLAVLAVVARAQKIAFIEPGPPGPTLNYYTDNPVFTFGSSITISWSGTSSNITLGMWQDPPNDEYDQYEVLLRKSTTLRRQTILLLTQLLVIGNETVSSYDWAVTTNLSLAVSPVFYLAIYLTEDQQAWSAISHYFNLSRSSAVTAPASISSMSSTSATSTTSSSTSSSATSIVSPITGGPASEAPTVVSAHKGLSTGAKIGLGAGFGLGCVVAIIAALVARWYLRGRRNRLNRGRFTQPARPLAEPNGYDKPELDARPARSLAGYNDPKPELDGTPVGSRLAELSSRHEPQ